MSILKILVVDDSVMYRSILTRVIKGIPDMEVVAAASTGKLALDRLAITPVDIVTLDIEMPGMNGIETLDIIRQKYPHVTVIMVSSLTKKGADVTLQALEKGAFDFIAKPDEGSPDENEAYFDRQLKIILRTVITRKALCSIQQKRTLKKHIAETETHLLSEQTSPFNRNQMPRPRAVAIGSSTGGPNALAQLLPTIPVNFPVPIFIVQHMPPVFTASLSESLNAKCHIRVVEAQNGAFAEAGAAYIAPGGKQMKVISHKESKKIVIKITDDPPENFCKPSADYLFRSIAKEYNSKAMGVILTGMGSDGTIGLRLMKRNKVYVIGQNEETCVVYGMPAEAKKAGVVDIELPIQDIAAEIINVVSAAR